MDLLIGTHTKSLDLTFVTNNVGEFLRNNGLQVEDWEKAVI
jgi:predicted nucleic acid-binding protein